MKILVISYKFYPDIGGIEVNTEILCNEFSKLGADVTLVTTTKGNVVTPGDYKVLRRPSLFRLLQEHFKADIVFENNPCLSLSWPQLIFPRPHVIAIRTWINRNNGDVSWKDRLKYKWLKKANNVIAVSEAVRTRCWKNAVVIGNPYRNTMFRWEKKNDRFGFVFMGRLVSDKGGDMAIKALAHIAKMQEYRDHPDLILYVIGSGPEESNLKQLTLSLKLQEKVVFLGKKTGSELVSALNRCKFLLAPSKWEEPFGNVALEGLACGLIPIVSDGGGLPDAVGKAGLIFQRNDLEDLVRLMRKVLVDVENNERLVNNISEHLKKHNPTYIAEKYFDVLQRSIAK